jgi:hypothetical protein
MTIILILLSFFIFSNSPAIAAVFETEIHCNGTSSKIIQDCPNDGRGVCKNQQWLLEKRAISLDKNWPVAAVACLPTKGGKNVVFYLSNDGNCQSCEVFEVWAPNGVRVSDKKASGYFSLTDFKYLNRPERLQNVPNFNFFWNE